jgi:hypothetical protein
MLDPKSLGWTLHGDYGFSWFTWIDYVFVGSGAALAGAINAIAGGGSLISFPALVAAGLSPVTASVTNTVAMCPGYLGATLSQRRDLVGQGGRAARILPVAAIGGVAGALLLLRTGDAGFDAIVPFLILFSSLLLAAQGKLRAWLVARAPAARSAGIAAIPCGIAAIYGGYFGAGMGVMVLAALAIVLEDSLTRLNALKQTVSLVVNVAAAVVFLFSGRVAWPFALVMFACSLVGGWVGGRVSTWISPNALRWTVVTIGVAVAIIYFVK